MLKKLFLSALTMSFIIGVAGCNTMEGLGKDVSKLGDKIENKADEKKKY